LIAGHGYGIQDTIYYVKEKGKCIEVMEVVVNNMAKVEKMIELF
jgi:hypothetical protein